MNPSQQLDSTSRREWIIVGLLLLSGTALRFAWPARMAVEHFDEGVYSSNLWFLDAERPRFPGRHLYAPPLLPALIQETTTQFGAGHLPTMLPGLLFGSLTILVVWRIARSWFGPVAGISAAALAAFSDFHIQYSRTALTDPVLTFWLTAALACFAAGLSAHRSRWMIPAGLTTGLAWITKYNGWLPLFFAWTAVPAWWCCSRSTNKRMANKLAGLVLASLLAVIVVVPVWRDLQTDGGYAVVQANHAKYLVGVSGWFSSLTRQTENLRSFDGTLSITALALAVLLPLFLSPRKTKFPTLFACAALCVAIAAWTGVAVVYTMLSSVGLWLGWVGRRQEGMGTVADVRWWLWAAWFCGLFAATPLYFPYPRLTLPWLVSSWLGAGLGISQFALCTQMREESALRWFQSRRVCWAVTALALASLVPRTAHFIDRGVPAWESRAGIENLSQTIVRDLSAAHEGPFAIYVYAEPSVVFHLRAAGVPSQQVAPAGSLVFANDRLSPDAAPVYLIAGPHAERSNQFQTEWEDHASRFRLVRSYENAPSLLVRLNHGTDERTSSPNKYTLYRFLGAKP